MKRFLVIAVWAIAAGCASLDVNSTVEKIAIQQATMRYIEDGAGRAERADRIVKAVQDARIMLDMEGVRLADLQAAMMARITKADLEPSDRALLLALADVAVSAVNVEIGDGVLSPEKRVRVNAVLAWVEQAASFY